MPIFKDLKNKLTKIKERVTPVEKDIQRITEENLDEIFGLEFISSEFALNNLRIDTLCFNCENNSFVIIEYKKDRSFSVIDQGFAYLALMVNNKAEFLLEYNEKIKNKHLNREDVNWSQSKIIFISPYFTPHQKAAINFKNLPLELWEINYYDEKLIEYKKIEPIESSENIEAITGGDKIIKEVTKDIKPYDLDWHLKKGSEYTRKLFYALKEKIMDLGEIKEKYLQFYVSYRAGDSYISFCQVHFYKEKLLIAILIEDKKLIDSKKWVKKAPKSYGWAKNCKFFSIKSEKDIKYAIDLIEQSYEFNKNR
ncbi:MAG: hypothetical protein A2998_01090 [Candidatus Staskawiczbacteria bacterium RIFCSPLOWO2_01_FULL_37_25b]|uniref:Uncharacterized protein n=2 Tax=Candidatus Staskawicziibacteriota TaxID=1817916 RepID=A0A1G2HKN8_9BACT|nr:MAG: hypothetical protein A2812_02565 [Candidatus Staskawiczbacteria bacterium RIFCSPHIGHO2_01_FULL_36_16]OGZ72015.1 MAG: hypothetical protein A2998_01090 [Candidatus Staskawiczbacteria bacterium RIFCSPLOWO2_01_FULL_37_25b]